MWKITNTSKKPLNTGTFKNVQTKSITKMSGRSPHIADKSLISQAFFVITLESILALTVQEDKEEPYFLHKKGILFHFAMQNH